MNLLRPSPGNIDGTATPPSPLRLRQLLSHRTTHRDTIYPSSPDAPLLLELLHCEIHRPKESCAHIRIGSTVRTDRRAVHQGHAEHEDGIAEAMQVVSENAGYLDSIECGKAQFRRMQWGMLGSHRRTSARMVVDLIVIYQRTCTLPLVTRKRLRCLNFRRKLESSSIYAFVQHLSTPGGRHILLRLGNAICSAKHCEIWNTRAPFSWSGC